jgi:outer membrane protein assembly factor BamB
MKYKTISRILIISAMIFFLVPSINTSAGNSEFKQLQSIKLPFTPSTHWYTHTDDFKFFLCSTKSDMLMLDGTTGKILWQKNFEKDFSNKKFSNQFWNKAANVVLLYDEDTKKGMATKYFIDGKTGNILWSSDKYVSDLGRYELSTGFSWSYDPITNGVLLLTKESVDLIDINTGKLIWSKPLAITGKTKDLNCYIMEYYDLVRIITGDETEILLTIRDGKEVSDSDPYFNKKKFMANMQHARIIDIPEKDMYVLMLGETDPGFSAFTGIDLPKRKLSFMGYKAGTDELIWSKKYVMSFAFDWVSKDDYFITMHYDNGKLFVEHNPSPKPNTGLTVLNPDNGEILWECQFKASEVKSAGLSKNLTTPFPAPDPVSVNGKTYVVNKVKNIVSCYDENTGAKIWDSEDFPDAQKIPTLYVTDGLVIMGYGGDELKCASITQTNGPNIERYEYNNKDKYGIFAYDAATGKVGWSSETIEKKEKVKFDYIAGMRLIDGKLFCATDKNFFILDPKTGDVKGNIPVAKEKLGDAWKMFYFDKEKKIILNCDKGIMKIDPATLKIEGVVNTSTLPYYQASRFMQADDPYQDYAIFTSGDAVKGTFKEFASIDLDNMTIRGTDDGELLFSNIPHFSKGGEMFYKVDGGEISIYSVK